MKLTLELDLTDIAPTPELRQALAHILSTIGIHNVDANIKMPANANNIRAIVRKYLDGCGLEYPDDDNLRPIAATVYHHDPIGALALCAATQAIKEAKA